MLRETRGLLMTTPLGQTRSSRYPIQLPLLYWRKSGTRTRVGAGWTRELGEKGFTAELAERFDVQTTLRVRIQTDRGPIETEAKVVWIGASTPPGAENYYGLTFTRIEPDHLEALRDLILPLSMVAHAGMRLAVDLPVTCVGAPSGGLDRGRGRRLSVSEGVRLVPGRGWGSLKTDEMIVDAGRIASWR